MKVNASDEVESGASVTVSRILHAGYVFESGGTSIAFDPVFENPFSRNCRAFPSVNFDLEKIRRTSFDAVFISHHHDDHCSLESLDLLDRKTPIYLYCVHHELFELIRALGFEQVHPLVIDEPVQVGVIEVIPRRAHDAEVDSMFHVRIGSLNILNVVDSLIEDATMEQLATHAPWDLVLWPFQTLREIGVIAPSRTEAASTSLPSEYLEQLKMLRPRFVVPSSCQFRQEEWSWYNHALFPITYRTFEREVLASLPETQVVRMNPSVSVQMNASGLRATPALAWVLPVGPQDVEYDFRPQDLRPSTASIARHLPMPTEEQAARVRDYCERGLLARYRSLGPPDDPYFQKSRLWRLSIFDSSGDETRFHFRVDEDELIPASAEAGPIGWLTEVPLVKLFAALFDGESLTSMYVRINDTIFDERTEHELAAADVLSDPLVRCLFNGVTGAYQAAQLRRLKSAKDLATTISSVDKSAKEGAR